MSDDAHTTIKGWPKCDTCGLASVRDGSTCTVCSAKQRVMIDGHTYLPAAGPAGVQAGWRPCDYAGCGEPWWRHKLYAPASVGELEGTAPGAPHPVVDKLSARVAHDARPTSAAAAEQVLPKTGTQRRAVLDALVGAEDGATDDELAAATGLPLNSVRPRRGELVDAELVMDSGDTRPSDQGNDAVVWLPTLKGLQAAVPA